MGREIEPFFHFTKGVLFQLIEIQRADSNPAEFSNSQEYLQEISFLY